MPPMSEPASERRLAVKLKTRGRRVRLGRGRPAPQAPSRRSSPSSASMSCGVPAVSMIRSSELRTARHGAAIGGYDHVMRAQALGVVGLAGDVVSSDHMGAHGPRQLDRHMAESADADHADAFAGAGLPVPKRRVGGDTCAEQRRCRGGVDAGRDSHHEPLVHDDGGGIAALRRPARLLLLAAVGAGHAALAVLLEPLCAAGAIEAAVDDAADAHHVTRAVAGDLAADGDHPAHDLVSRDLRVLDTRPIPRGRSGGRSGRSRRRGSRSGRRGRRGRGGRSARERADW